MMLLVILSLVRVTLLLQTLPRLVQPNSNAYDSLSKDSGGGAVSQDGEWWKMRSFIGRTKCSCHLIHFFLWGMIGFLSVSIKLYYPCFLVVERFYTRANMTRPVG